MNTVNFSNSYLNLPNCLYHRCQPDRSPNPELILFNDELAQEIDLQLPFGLKTQLLSANQLIPGSEPIALAYAGHQFGHFTILGDGRAHLLGEHISKNGRRYDIQLKGSGRTPYSRHADGKAALGPMLREYIISEAMHALNIPTTRSLAVVKSGQPIYRDIILDGAVLTRIANSHLRIGTFEFVAYLNDVDTLSALLDYAIDRHSPYCKDANDIALAFIDTVMNKQIDLTVEWMRVGFIHGVMNTDNISIAGDTLDYGPCGFMDNYDPNTVFSSIDSMGRYAYGNQPTITKWNISCLVHALLPLLKNEQAIIELLNQFDERYEAKWLAMMGNKIGLVEPKKTDLRLIQSLLDLMHRQHLDFTKTFFDISYENYQETIYQTSEFMRWHSLWQKRLSKQGKSKQETYAIMRSVNPCIIPRNHRVEYVLQQAEVGNLKALKDFLFLLKNPYHYNKKLKDFQTPPTASERVYETFCGT